MSVEITGFWTFFCNPAKWQIDKFLASKARYDTYFVTPWQAEYFQSGQLGVVRVGVDRRTKEQLEGQDKLSSGIYAVVRVLSEAKTLASFTPDEYWIDWDEKEANKPSIEIEYLENMLRSPLLLDEIRDDPQIAVDKYLVEGFQASSMPLNEIAFDRILALVQDLKVEKGKKSFRNPNWSRDELILALDLYFRVNPIHTNETHPQIIELSDLLNELPIHEARFKGLKFRNSSGVYMKLCNFLRFDPNYEGEGLKRGGKLEGEIWQEFASDRLKLRNTARAIKENYKSLPLATEGMNDLEDEEFIEGRILSKVHRIRERNSTVVRKKKTKVLQDTGKLECDVCAFDFHAFYGDIGYGYAECHHTIPLSELEPDNPTKLSDLAIVCANCHRMIHRSSKWLSIKALKEIVKAIHV